LYDQKVAKYIPPRWIVLFEFTPIVVVIAITRWRTREKSLTTDIGTDLSTDLKPGLRSGDRSGGSGNLNSN
jgi:hypothetical protein